MKRGKYAEFNVQEGYIKNINTGEIIGNHLDLYCYTADENNIYYETPHMDYPENYAHVKNGEEISIREYFEKNGVYEEFYAIISKHKKIVSIENFKLDECNTFYSIYISKEIAKFLYELGFENFEIKENLFKWKLNEMPQNLKGTEILFFIDSEDELIQELLNKKRFNSLKRNLSERIKEKVEGLKFIYIENFPFELTYTDEDEYFIRKALKEKTNSFINSGIKIDLNFITIEKIYKELEKEKKYWNKYKDGYLSYIKKVLTKSFNLDNLTENFLKFGYTNSEIISYILEEDKNELL